MEISVETKVKAPIDTVWRAYTSPSGTSRPMTGTVHEQPAIFVSVANSARAWRPRTAAWALTLPVPILTSSSTS